VKFAMSIFQRRQRKSKRPEIRFGAWPTLLASILIFACALWFFCDVFYRWPKSWARSFYGYSIFLAPVMAILTVCDCWRARRDIRLIIAAVFGAAGFGLICYTFYLAIHRFNNPA